MDAACISSFHHGEIVSIPCRESFCHRPVVEAWSRVLADGASAPGRHTTGRGGGGGSVIEALFGRSGLGCGVQ